MSYGIFYAARGRIGFVIAHWFESFEKITRSTFCWVCVCWVWSLFTASGRCNRLLMGNSRQGCVKSCSWVSCILRGYYFVIKSISPSSLRSPNFCVLIWRNSKKTCQFCISLSKKFWKILKYMTKISENFSKFSKSR